jgi:hypothetical protein
MKPSGLELWLQQGREIRIGPKTFTLLPTPIAKLRGIQNWLDDTTKGVLLEALKEEDTPSPWGLVANVLMQVDVYDLCVKIFERKHPETGEPINKELTREYLEEYLDTPATRQIILAFIEINELEEALKNLQSLPVVGSLMEALKTTFGLPFLKHLQTSTDSLPSTLEGSASPSLDNTSEAVTGGTRENGPVTVSTKGPVSTPGPAYKM